MTTPYYIDPVQTGPAINANPVQTAQAAFYQAIRTLEVGDVFYYEHDQTVPAGDWLVQHNLGKYPNVSVFDATGAEVLADIQNVDANAVHVIFSYMASGKAICS